MSSETDEIAAMFEDATKGIREGLSDIVKAHIAKELGGQFAIAELARIVFNNSSTWAQKEGEKWIDVTLRRAVENNVESIIDELLTERRDELVAEVRKTIEGKDIAGMIAEKVVAKVDRASY